MKPMVFSGLMLMALAGCTSQQVSTAIADACAAAPIILDTAAALAKGGAAGPTGAVAVASGLIGPSCTLAGQIQLGVNDAQPVTPTNSGNSAAWVLQTATDALTAAKASATSSSPTSSSGAPASTATPSS